MTRARAEGHGATWWAKKIWGGELNQRGQLEALLAQLITSVRADEALACKRAVLDAAIDADEGKALGAIDARIALHRARKRT